MLRTWLLRPRTAKPLGQRGEDAAVRFLKRLGYKIVARGRRDGLGELDIVAVDMRDSRGPTVVFVEVKTRVSHAAGHPADAVDAEKQRRITNIALGYLRRHGLLDYPSRFDVVAVIWPKDEKKPTIEHYKSAFEAIGDGQMFS